MTSEELERMESLCKRIAVEKDPKVFDKLVAELDDVLEVKYGRLHPEQVRKPEQSVSSTAVPKAKGHAQS